MSFTEFEAHILRVIGEDPDSPDVFSDTSVEMSHIRNSMNEAVQELTMISGGHRTSFTIPLAKQVSFYSVRPRQGFLAWISEAWDVNRRRRLERTDLHRLNTLDPRWMRSEGNADSYFEIGPEHIGIYPKPSGNSDVLMLQCVIIPDIAQDNRRLTHLRRQFQWAVTDYAISEYFAARGRIEEASEYGRSYAETARLSLGYPRSREYTPTHRTNKDPWPTEGSRATP